MTWYLADKGRVNRKRKEKGASVRMSCVYHTGIGLGARRCRTYGNLPGMKIRLIPPQKIRKISCPSISRSISTDSESFLTDLLAQLLLYHPRGFQPGEQVQKCQQDPGNYRDPGCGGLWPIASDARCSVRFAKRFLFEQAHPGDKRGGTRYPTRAENIELRASRHRVNPNRRTEERQGMASVSAYTLPYSPSHHPPNHQPQCPVSHEPPLGFNLQGR